MLCDISMHTRTEEAKSRYIVSELHTEFLLSSSFTDVCDTARAALSRGEVAPALPVCCCKDSFRIILSSEPEMDFKVCVPDEERIDDVEEYRRRFIASPELVNLPIDELEEELMNNYDCALTSTSLRCTDDAEYKSAYLAALGRYFEAAAAFAKGICSPAAMQFMEALRRLLAAQPNRPTSLADALKAGFAKGLTANAADALFALATSAQEQLWKDWTISGLKPLSQRRSAPKGRK